MACPSPDSIFILCDIKQRGFPIQYVSQGFADLYEYGQAECMGKNCGALVGGPSIQKDAKAIAHVVEVSSLPEDETRVALEMLTTFAAEQCSAMFAEEGFGFTLLLNRKKGGGIFVCELLTVVLQRPDLGWSFAIGLQRDVTHKVPVLTLLKAAACGELSRLVDESKAGVASRLAQLGINKGGVARYVHDNAVERAQKMRPATMSRQKAPPAAAAGASQGQEVQSLDSASRATHSSPATSSRSAAQQPSRSAKDSSSRAFGSLGQIAENCAEESEVAPPAPASVPPTGLQQARSGARTEVARCLPSMEPSKMALGSASGRSFVESAGVGLAEGTPSYVQKPRLLGSRQAGRRREKAAK